jgi:hypothetical protein
MEASRWEAVDGNPEEMMMDGHSGNSEALHFVLSAGMGERMVSVLDELEAL